MPSVTIDPLGIKSAILEVEYTKAGGKENYDILTRAQQLSLSDPQNQGNLKAMKQYIDSFGADTNTAGAPADTSAATPGEDQVVSGEKLDKMINEASLQGNKNANIVVIEYSDMECPFCIKQYQNTQLWPKLQEKYGDKVAFAFKNNRGVNHPGTEAKSLGALCAKKLGGDSAYIKFYTTVMDGSSQGSVYDVARLPEAAKAAGVDEKAWKDCVDTKSTLSIFDAETEEAQGFNLGGTPGTLIINLKTGKYATIEGAYPLTSFVSKIDSLMQ